MLKELEKFQGLKLRLSTNPLGALEGHTLLEIVQKTRSVLAFFVKSFQETEGTLCCMCDCMVIINGCRSYLSL